MFFIELSVPRFSDVKKDPSCSTVQKRDLIGIERVTINKSEIVSVREVHPPKPELFGGIKTICRVMLKKNLYPYTSESKVLHALETRVEIDEMLGTAPSPTRGSAILSRFRPAMRRHGGRGNSCRQS